MNSPLHSENRKRKQDASLEDVLLSSRSRIASTISLSPLSSTSAISAAPAISDADISLICTHKPRTMEELCDIQEFGLRKALSFGPALLSVINGFISSSDYDDKEVDYDDQSDGSFDGSCDSSSLSSSSPSSSSSLISSSASPRILRHGSLTALPIEILENVFSFLIKPQDLLHWKRGCKARSTLNSTCRSLHHLLVLNRQSFTAALRPSNIDSVQRMMTQGVTHFTLDFSLQSFTSEEIARSLRLQAAPPSPRDRRTAASDFLARALRLPSSVSERISSLSFGPSSLCTSSQLSQILSPPDANQFKMLSKIAFAPPADFLSKDLTALHRIPDIKLFSSVLGWRPAAELLQCTPADSLLRSLSIHCHRSDRHVFDGQRVTLSSPSLETLTLAYCPEIPSLVNLSALHTLNLHHPSALTVWFSHQLSHPTLKQLHIDSRESDPKEFSLSSIASTSLEQISWHMHPSCLSALECRFRTPNLRRFGIRASAPASHVDFYNRPQVFQANIDRRTYCADSFLRRHDLDFLHLQTLQMTAIPSLCAPDFTGLKHLKKLYIYNCQNMTKINVEDCTSLVRTEITGCPLYEAANTH